MTCFIQSFCIAHCIPNLFIIHTVMLYKSLCCRLQGLGKGLNLFPKKVKKWNIPKFYFICLIDWLPTLRVISFSKHRLFCCWPSSSVQCMERNGSWPIDRYIPFLLLLLLLYYDQSQLNWELCYTSLAHSNSSWRHLT